MWQRLLIISLAVLPIFLYIQKRKKAMIRPLNSKSLERSKFKGLTKYIEAMARHETGNYQSDLFKRANNMFGMRVPKVRTFERVGTSNNYSVYCCTDQSIRDLILWMEFTKFPPLVRDSLDFVSELKRRAYFEDSIGNYLAGVNFHLNQINNGK